MTKVEDFFNKQPLDLFEIISLEVLTSVYLEKRKTNSYDWQDFSNLLIDKFAIHSASFFHLSKGIIEHKKSGELRMGAYDLFTVNSTFRAMMETYTTFHHLCVEPVSDAEKEFRFLLWKIDSLAEKQKFEVSETDFPEAKEILKADKVVFTNTIDRIDNSEYIKLIPRTVLAKVYNKDKGKFSWRFKFSENNIQTLKIIELVRHVFKTPGFFNLYKYTSLHTHSNYLSLEYFQKIRNKEISDEYSLPLDKHAVIMLCMLIHNIVQIDVNAEAAFKKIPFPLQEFILKVSKKLQEISS